MSGPFTQIVQQVRPGSAVLLPSACATTGELNDELTRQSERLAGTTLWSGLLLGDCSFAEPPHLQRLRYGTWHIARSLSGPVASGDVDYYPLRASHVIDFLHRKNLTDVVVAQVAPPDVDGYCSLGVSGSYLEAAASSARQLILHVNPRMPVTRGCKVRLADAANVVTHEAALPSHPGATADGTSHRIASHIEPLIRDGATLQVGLGSVPEAILESLLGSDREGFRVWGMATDGVVALDEAGKLQRGSGPSVHAHDVMGSQRIFDWIHDNDDFRLVGYDVGTSQERIAGLERFVSINSVLEIDLLGNANAEVIGHHQISGVGGSVDFVEGARRSRGGVSILALPATAREGTVSRIVPRLDGVPHSIPRTCVQWVVTEHGAVDLSLLGLQDRAEALVGLAAPKFRDELWERFDEQARRKDAS